MATDQKEYQKQVIELPFTEDIWNKLKDNDIMYSDGMFNQTVKLRPYLKELEKRILSIEDDEEAIRTIYNIGRKSTYYFDQNESIFVKEIKWRIENLLDTLLMDRVKQIKNKSRSNEK